jgi:hypothetical protein
MLFDEVERTDASPAGYEEDSFSFLNRVDQPYWQPVRDELERWYADYPDEEHGFGLRARFRDAAGAHHFRRLVGALPSSPLSVSPLPSRGGTGRSWWKTGLPDDPRLRVLLDGGDDQLFGHR